MRKRTGMRYQYIASMKSRKTIGMRRVAVSIGLIALGWVHAVSARDESRVLRLATTTSTYETGLLDTILPPFEKQQDAKVHVISVGTGKAMAIARAGDVDIILVHAREAEERFVRGHFGLERHPVMANDFIIVGPASDPAGIAGLHKSTPAMLRLAKAQHLFVSRGDDSGTHQKEEQLWSAAGIVPHGEWYIELGQGMSASLTVADEKNAYVLVDRASYIANRKRLRLRILMEGDPTLQNPYGVIVVNPARHPHVKIGLAEALVEWLLSSACQQLIGEFAQDGVLLFKPIAAVDTEAGKRTGEHVK